MMALPIRTTRLFVVLAAVATLACEPAATVADVDSKDGQQHQDLPVAMDVEAKEVGGSGVDASTGVDPDMPPAGDATEDEVVESDADTPKGGDSAGSQPALPVPLPADTTYVTFSAGPIPCDDLLDCTIDTATPSGCVYLVKSTGWPCDTGTACGGQPGQCPASCCQSGGVFSCDDFNPCTVDVCNGAAGCSHTPVAAGAQCSDGNPCTTSESCAAEGTCKGGQVVVCDDGDPCTVDACDPQLGCVANSMPCPSPDPCQLPGKWCGGVCVPSNKSRIFDRVLPIYSAKSTVPFCGGLLETSFGFVGYCQRQFVWVDKSGETIAVQPPQAPGIPFAYMPVVATSPSGAAAIGYMINPPNGFDTPVQKLEFWGPAGLVHSEECPFVLAIAATPLGWTVVMRRTDCSAPFPVTANNCPHPEIRRYHPDGTLLDSRVGAVNSTLYEDWGRPLPDGGWLGNPWGPATSITYPKLTRRDANGQVLWIALPKLSIWGPTSGEPDGAIVMAWASTTQYGPVPGNVPYDANYDGLARLIRISPAGAVSLGAPIRATAALDLWPTSDFLDPPPFVSQAGTIAELGNSDLGPVAAFGHDLKPIWRGGIAKGGPGTSTKIWPLSAVMAEGGDAVALYDIASPSNGLEFHLLRTDNWGHSSCQVAGKCAGLSVAQCDDGIPCTIDGCDPAGGCTHLAVPYACADGDPCTEDDCTKDGCTAKPAKGNLCDDGQPCTTADLCGPNGCQAGVPDCDDENPCTADTCSGAACGHLELAGPCEDGLACTENACVGGLCRAVSTTCPCTGDVDCELGATCAVAHCVQGKCQLGSNPAPALQTWSKTIQLSEFVAPVQPALPAAVPAPDGGILVVRTSQMAAYRADGSERWVCPTPAEVRGAWSTVDGGALAALAAGTDAKLVQVASNGVATDLGILANCSRVNRAIPRATGGWLVLGTRSNSDGYTTCRVWRLDGNAKVEMLGDPLQSPATWTECLTAVELVDGGVVAGGAQVHDDYSSSSAIGSLNPQGAPGFYITVLGKSLEGLALGTSGELLGTVRTKDDVRWLRMNPQGKVLDVRRLDNLKPGYAAGTMGVVALGKGAMAIASLGKWVVVDGAGVAQGAPASWPSAKGDHWSLGLGADETLVAIATAISYAPLALHVDVRRMDAWGHSECAAAGGCLGKSFANCADANPCTQDACTPKTSCTHAWFADGTVCGKGMRCRQGQCMVELP